MARAVTNRSGLGLRLQKDLVSHAPDSFPKESGARETKKDQDCDFRARAVHALVTAIATTQSNNTIHLAKNSQ